MLLDDDGILEGSKLVEDGALELTLGTLVSLLLDVIAGS